MLGSAGLVAQDFFGRKYLHAVGHATQCIRAISGFIFSGFFVSLVFGVYGCVLIYNGGYKTEIQ